MGKDTFATREHEGSTALQEQSGIAVRSSENVGHSLRTVGLIIGREYKNQVTQRSFRIGTIITMVLLALAACVPTAIEYFTSSSPAQTKIVIVNRAGPVAGLSGDALTKHLETTLTEAGARISAPGQAAGAQPSPVIVSGSATSLADLQQQVKDGKLDMVLVIDRSAIGNLSFTQYMKTASAESSALSEVGAAVMQLNLLDQASRLNLTPEQAQRLSAQPEVNAIALQQEPESRSAGERVAGYVIAYIGIALIAMSVYLYGNTVAQGVAEEKGGRIMEILINAATPFQLMLSKILGIGAAALTQIASFVVVAISAVLLQAPLRALLLGNARGGLSLDVASISIAPLLLLVLYFLLGFLLYATLFAGVGALVRRQDEAQNAVSPITLFFTAGYLVSFIAIYVPDAAWVKVMSHIPFWTPVLMVVRAGVSTIAWWEIVVSVAVMVVTIIVCTLLAARIYRLGVLMYGQKPGARQLIKVLRS